MDSLTEVSIGGRACGDMSWYSEGYIKCTAPPGVGVHLDVRVRVKGQVHGDTAWLRRAFSYHAPVINGHQPPPPPSY